MYPESAFGALPDSVSPTLTLLPQYKNETDYFIGELSKLQLVAAFPSGTTSDVNIELLPSTNTTVMGLGVVTVSKVGSNLNIPTPTMVRYETEETKSAAVKIFNRGVFAIGDIINTGNSLDYVESTLVIEFEAVVASISGISDSDIHWVSAGIEYNNSYNNVTNNSTYELNDVGGYTLGINSMKVLTYAARIPYPYPQIASEVIVLTNTTDSLHVIGLRLLIT
ncbi:hypothetical protein KUTeg_020458 [Tegillarca granosa]|uniref:Uncharacterized protein n=1 Tax=Tegillarca granosa TaxID=220873 RepID=A0ABQ9EAP8_TEGGR|nr:hypothetical protein KUTeg_020458 [Tegillarca granosa]